MNADSIDPYEPPSSTFNDGTDSGSTKSPNKRVCAFLIDLFLFAMLESILVVFWEILAVFGLACLLFRDALMHGQSPGKKIVGLRVTDDEGHPCTPLKSFLRNIILLPLLLIPITLLIEYFVLRYSHRERRLGDRIAKTVVQDLNPEKSDGVYIWYSIIVIVIGAVVSTIVTSLVSNF